MSLASKPKGWSELPLRDRPTEDEIQEELRSAAFNPDQPRDKSGQWTSGGPSDDSGDTVESVSKRLSVITDGTVDGRTIPDFDDEFGPGVPNMSSISASLTEYEILDGIREVPLSEFQDNGKPSFYSATEEERVKELAAAIKESNTITPLIVVYDGDSRGPYVLEGGHRFDALKLLDAKSLPALVVIDKENMRDKKRNAAFNPDQPRDEDGQWTSGGGGEASTSSPEFKSWFGDSKVVNKDGSPKRMYHSGSFDERDGVAPEIGPEGMHFGTKWAAMERIQGKRIDDAIKSITTDQDEEGRWHYSIETERIDSSDYGDPDVEAGFDTQEEAQEAAEFVARDIAHQDDGSFGEEVPITEVYLSIKNPKRMTDQQDDWSEAVRKAKEEGHDGIVYKNGFEDKGSDSWIVFEPEQIKSVKNKGGFDKTNKLIDARRKLRRRVLTPTKRLRAGAARITVLGDHLRVTAPKIKGFAFDRTNPRAQEWVREHVGELIDEMSKSTRTRVKDLVGRAFDGEFDTHDLADKITDLIGDDVRAETIARTETMAASNGGQREAWAQAVEEGLLNGDEQEEWIVTPDDALCEICQPMDGERKPLGGKFNVNGELMDGPPAHPRCRCTTGLAIVT